ncbi:MAG: M48 family metalloprotease [Candidatus Endonucleobacter bathymodioli]|uniref:Putative beta-barrel assembly-enhancing protease n=1 Tax=Candidatus Endonucleibacter bathymodioli TaxID=539814 RepID=A0AA90SSX4_9GAMM|nr:M48 family metalloprotease [Candidatus Endonucleobacter bathymodioli]
MRQSRPLPAFFIGYLLTTVPIHAHSDLVVLPNLGDYTSGIISQQQEFELGRNYLKILRHNTPTIDDPELKSYLERLISRLAESSEIKDHRLITLLINETTLNAFAAPGGIIGVNIGLFIQAKTEAQFAAVLAHELAHLSQRHYARNVKEAQNKTIPTAAAIIASIILMAAGGGNAGAAALTSTMAGLHSSRLSFSRQYEQEADNIGIKTLARAGFDPYAMPDIFEQMSKANRYSSHPPEFLSTHPVTANRISDSRARADQIKNKGSKGSHTYQLMRMRTIFFSTSNTHYLLTKLNLELKSKHTGLPDVSRYGIALAAIKTRDYDLAKKQLSILLQKEPNNLYYITTKAKLDAKSGNSSTALKQINKLLETHLNYYPLLIAKTEILTQQKNHKEARNILLQLSHMRPEDPDIWYILAEVQGQADDILGLHLARAEFFFLTGSLDDAIKHIQYAQKLTGKNFILKAKLNKKLTDIHNYRKKIAQ